jgi:hypothetical protein
MGGAGILSTSPAMAKKETVEIAVYFERNTATQAGSFVTHDGFLF